MPRIVLVVALLGWCLPSAATDVTLMGGYQFNSDFEIIGGGEQVAGAASPAGEPGEEVNLEDAAAFSLAVDFLFQQQQDKRIGFFVTHAQTRFDDNAGLANRDMDVTHVHFTAMSYYPGGRMEPFVMAGIGAGFFSPEDATLKDQSKFSAQIAAGTNYRFTDNFLLRLDARWIPTFFDGSGSAFCNGGCTITVKSSTYSQVQANIGLMFRF